MSRLDPQKHHRRSIRLPGWDYRTPGVYFLTICTHERECLFNNQAWANIARIVWTNIPTHSDRIVLDEWVLMPNHIHGILVLTDSLASGAPVTPFDWRWATQSPAAEPRRFANAPSGSLGSIVRSYKAAVTRRINERCNTLGCKRWQRGYYERIVRDNHELERIRLYVQDNPARWAEDRDNLDALLERMTYHDK
jgi:REP element-mobilizing transposase RayT